MNKPAEFWIERLNLVEHPGEEDGFFAVPFEDSFTILNRNKVQNCQKDLKIIYENFKEERPVASIAYFLQKKAEIPTTETMMFKCLSTEMLFYHAGLPLSIYILEKANISNNSFPLDIFSFYPPIQDATNAQDLKHVILGPRVDQGQVLAFPVPADTWFTRLVDTTEKASVDYSLFSCSLAPGFHVADFKAKILKNILNDIK